MITPRAEVLLETGEDRLSIMLHARRFAVEQSRRAHNAPTENLPDRLMAQTDAENWHLPGKLFNYFCRNAGFIWCSGSRRNHNPGGLHRLDFCQRDFIVSAHFNSLAQLAEILYEVVGE